jgi:hypothetical protein
MSSILTSQLNVTNTTTTSVGSAITAFVKEALSVLTLFACAAIPVVLLSLTWA